MKLDADQQNLLNAFRISYGMLGTIFEATLSVRPISTFTAKHRKLDIDTFATVTDRLAQGKIGMRFSLLPYMNEVYLELQVDLVHVWQQRKTHSDFALRETIGDGCEGIDIKFSVFRRER